MDNARHVNWKWIVGLMACSLALAGFGIVVALVRDPLFGRFAWSLDELPWAMAVLGATGLLLAFTHVLGLARAVAMLLEGISQRVVAALAAVCVLIGLIVLAETAVWSVVFWTAGLLLITSLADPRAPASQAAGVPPQHDPAPPRPGPDAPDQATSAPE